MGTRIEKDSFGEIAIDNSCLWGANTQRSLENFPIGNERMPLELILALVTIKKAAAYANLSLGALSEEKAHAIGEAADEILYQGKWRDQFPLVIW
ncbi:MAG: class II fumarate hydratase, partial [Chlamydiia bacterium]|nr:class II fumarate hydratase [Chlamydiia bacterium]